MTTTPARIRALLAQISKDRAREPQNPPEPHRTKPSPKPLASLQRVARTAKPHKTFNPPKPSISRAPHIFIRISGRIDWSCPRCSSLNKTYRKALYKPLRCSSCARQWDHGLLLYPMQGGHQNPPLDSLFIASLPALSRCVNKTLCDSCYKAIDPEKH